MYLLKIINQPIWTHRS